MCGLERHTFLSKLVAYAAFAWQMLTGRFG